MGTRRTLLVLVFFIILTFLHTWPLGSAPARLILWSPDTFVNVWALNDMARQLARDPLHLFDGNVFHPYPRTLATVDHLFSNVLLAAPLWEATRNLALVYNVVLLATFALSGLFTYLLVLRLSGSVTGGIVAGCAFAFSNFRFTHLMHLHLLGTQWLPLALLAMHAFLERPTWKRLVVVTATGALVALSSWNLALIGACGLAIVAIWTMAGDELPRVRRALMLVVAALVVAAVLVPFALPYVHVSEWRATSIRQEQSQEIARYSGRVEGLLAMGDFARAPYAQTLARFGSRESKLFPGVITLVLAAPTLLILRRAGARSRFSVSPGALVVGAALALTVGTVLAAAAGWEPLVRSARRAAPFLILGLAVPAASLWAAPRAHRRDPRTLTVLTYGTLAVISLLLSLGPRVDAWGLDAGPGIYRQDLIPVLSVIRVPARFSLLLALGLSVLTGLGAERLIRKAGATLGKLVVVLALILLNLDLRAAPLDVSPVPQQQFVHRWLKESPVTGAVIEYPTQGNSWAIPASLDYGRRIVNGAGYVWPPAMNRLAERDALSRRHIETFWEYLHPRFIVLRAGFYPPDARARVLQRIEEHADALILKARSGDDYVYELVDRGTGTVLHRRWPREALREAQGFDLAAAVLGTRPLTVTRLVVAFNDRTVLDVEAENLASPVSRMLPLPREYLVPGSNVLEIRGEYRFVDAAPANPIGDTGVTLTADAEVISGRNGSRVQLNGRLVEAESGYLLLVVDRKTGSIIETRQFNTADDETASQGLQEFVRKLPARTPVVVVSEGAASRRLSAAAVAALHELGLREDLRDRSRWAHAAIGVKGARPGSVPEAVDDRKAVLTLGAPEDRVVQLARLQVY